MGSGAKPKCEQEINTLGHDLDELRGEQEIAMALERDKKLLEAQTKDAQNRLDEAEQKAIAKMETRIRELESEYDAESRRLADAQKNLRRSERTVKELAYTQEEDRKNHERMQALIDQLQGKIKSYKKQIEEAEEIAALNLAKFRQVQVNLTQSSERADLNEQACKNESFKQSFLPCTHVMLQSKSERTLTLMTPANTDTILYLASSYSKLK